MNGRIRLFVLLLLPTVPAAAAGNRLLDPDFDAPSGAWASTPTTFSWSSEDADGCVQSGSAQLPVDPPASVAHYLLQTVGATPGETLHAHARFRPGATGALDVAIGVYFFSNDACFEVAGYSYGQPVTLTDPGWVTAEIEVTAPAGTLCASVLLVAWNSGDSTHVWIDRAFLGSPAAIFDDGFEIGEACRWSAAVP